MNILIVPKRWVCTLLVFKNLFYSIQVTSALNYMVRMSSDLEIYSVAIERIIEYAQCPEEVCIKIAGSYDSHVVDLEE